MFQFIGRVLGVAHNPGYPFYVLITHPFSYLPVGSLAYRLNLFSALLGSLTVALVFMIARKLRCRRVVAAAVALGLAFGHVFWSQSVIAEVYTLHTAILSGIVLALLTWAETRTAAWYTSAIGLFAAGLGNHTTIVGFAPGIALFVVLKDRAFATRLGTRALQRSHRGRGAAAVRLHPAAIASTARVRRVAGGNGRRSVEGHARAAVPDSGCLPTAGARFFSSDCHGWFEVFSSTN